MVASMKSCIIGTGSLLVGIPPSSVKKNLSTGTFLVHFLQEDKNVSYNLLVYRERQGEYSYSTKKRLPGHAQIPTGRKEGWCRICLSRQSKEGSRSLACEFIPELQYLYMKNLKCSHSGFIDAVVGSYHPLHT